jgi:hypothetical protein
MDEDQIRDLIMNNLRIEISREVETYSPITETTGSPISVTLRWKGQLIDKDSFIIHDV